MASSGNFCLWNPHTTRGFINFTRGNTEAEMNTNYVAVDGTLAARTGKYYWEMNYSADGNFNDGRLYSGIHAIGTTATGGAPYHASDGSNHYNPDPGLGLFTVRHRNATGCGNSNIGGSGSTNGSTYVNAGLKVSTANTIIMCAMDLDNHTIHWGINGSWKGLANSTDSTSSTDITAVTGISIPSAFRGFHFAPAAYFSGASTGTKIILNCGQDSSFAGTKSTGTANAADGNSVGNFYYTPPSGYLALSTSNLPISSDIDPAETDNDIPTKLFGAEKWTGNGGTQTIQLGDGFQPDCVWTKNLGTSNSWIALDSSRGFNKTLKLETADGEGTNSYVGYGIESDFFASTGIKANGGGSPGFNNSTHNYIVYSWRANGGTTSTNTDGTTTSTVQANQAGGFSIITYTGTGTNRTIGHGLSSAPEFMIIKDRDGTNNWVVYSKDLGAAKRANLNNNIAWGSSTTSFQSTDPSSTVITLGTSSGVNQSTRNFVCYAWHSVEGFSKFGTFEGNSNADGPYIYTGFRPRFVICKGADATENWQLRDSARHSNTGTVTRLYTNSNAAEGTASTASPIDILSNGFKVRGSNSEINTNTIFYAAWGDVPFKYNNAR